MGLYRQVNYCNNDFILLCARMRVLPPELPPYRKEIGLHLHSTRDSCFDVLVFMEGGLNRLSNSNGLVVACAVICNASKNLR